MSTTIPGSFPGHRVRRLAGLLRLEVRGLAGIALSVAALVGLAAGLALYAFPIVLGVGSSAFWNVVSALVLVSGLPLVAQVFEADWRTGAAGVLRIAPVSRWSVFAAKVLAVVFWWLAAWCLVAPACWIGLSLAPEPSGEGAIVLSGIFDGNDFGRGRNAIAALAYVATAALSMVFRHALAATLGGLMAVAIPWLCLAALGNISSPIALFGLSCIGASLYVASHPLGTLAAAVALGGGVFLRGRAARGLVRRAAFVGALLLALVTITPGFLIAESALDEQRFDEPDAALDSVDVNPLTGAVIATTRHASGFGHRAVLWLVDPITGDVRQLPSPVLGLLSVLPGMPPYIGGGWTSDGQRFIGVVQLDSAGHHNAFVSIDPARGTARTTDNADYARELCYGGWDLDWLPGQDGQRIRVSRRGVEPFEFNARRLRAIPKLRPDLLFYVDHEDRLHRVDTASREDRVLDIAMPDGQLAPDVSPDGRWLVLRGKAPKTATLVEVETGRSRELPSWSYSWTLRDLPILVETLVAPKDSWMLLGLDSEETFELDLGDVWAPRDIDGTHWLVRTNKGGLFTVDSRGRIVRVLRHPR